MSSRVTDPDGPQGGSPSTEEKHGALFGGALTEEALRSSRTVLNPVRGNKNAIVGLQQWFSPPEAAELVAGVLGRQRAVLDLTAGSGALLAPFPEEARFGIEIDRDHARTGAYKAIAGDAQTVVPMLRATGLTFPAVAVNPPFGLAWRDPIHAKGDINSTTLAFLWALDILDRFGQGAMVCGRDRLARDVMARDESRGIYAVVDVDGPLFDGVALPTSVAFFVRPENRPQPAPSLRLSAARADLGSLAPEIEEARGRFAGYVTSYGTDISETARAFEAVAKEYAVRSAERRRRKRDATGHHLTLKGNNVVVRLSAFARLALTRVGAAREIELLRGQHVRYFGQNTRAWRQIEELRSGGHLTVAPALVEKAGQVLREAALHATPLFPVKEQMRLGWLTDLDRIQCKRSDPERGFEAGKSYDLKTGSKVATADETRVVDNKTGDPELRRFVTERKILAVRIGDHHLDESPENIAYVSKHFNLPDPGCVATRFPEEVRRNREVLEELEKEIRANHDRYMREVEGLTEFEPFSFKNFQLDHLSRLLTKGRGMLAHEQGLGKTLSQMTLAETTPKIHTAPPQALFIVPQDLIPQTQREARKFFNRHLEVIRTPAQARDVARRVNAGEAGWWITYYEALSIVGRKREALPPTPLNPRHGLHRRLQEFKDAKKLAAERSLDTGATQDPGPAQDAVDPGRIDPPDRDEGREEDLIECMTSRVACPECRATTYDGWDGEVCRRCSHVHRALLVKPAYSHLTMAFKRGVVCVDEISEIRGDDSLRSLAIRALARGPHRYGATGTPLSNFINDSFWGLWFALGNASPAFPYSYESKGKFEQDFAVIEYLMGRREDGEEHLRKRRRILPQVTNVSQFWRLTQPGVSRCRKEQTGEPLVPRTYHPIRVPMGVEQRKSHAFWLENFPDYFMWKYPDHQLSSPDLVEKFAAALGQLWRLENAATLPVSDVPSTEWPPAQKELAGLSNYTPANMKVLQLAMKHAANGEKILIGSDLIATGRWIAQRLSEKGVRAVHITEERSGKVGTKNPRKRAAEVEDFVTGDAQVLCAGVQAMKLGHNLDVASVVICHGLPYSHMVMDQFLARVHRLTSRREVSVYVIIPRGSLAERKWGLLKDKGGASDLAFDGELFVAPEKPVDWNRVLKEMKEQGIGSDGDEILETDVEAAWRKIAPLAFLPPARSTPMRSAHDDPAVMLQLPLAAGAEALDAPEMPLFAVGRTATSGRDRDSTQPSLF